MKSFFSLIVALFCLQAQGLQVDVHKIFDRKIGVCSKGAHIGNWAYQPLKVEARMLGSSLELNVALLSMSCVKRKHLESGVSWIGLRPYLPSEKVKGDLKTIVIPHVIEAVVYSPDTGEQVNVPVIDSALQVLRFELNPNVDKVIFRLDFSYERNGEMLQGSGGTYLLTVIP